MTPTAAEIWMRGQGVSKKKARQFHDFDPNAVELEWGTEIPPKGSVPEVERQKRIGGLLDRWEIRPPAIPPPPPAEQHEGADEAPEYAQARALLPLGTPLELHYLSLLLEDGTEPQEALRRVETSDRAAITMALTRMTYGGAA